MADAVVAELLVVLPGGVLLDPGAAVTCLNVVALNVAATYLHDEAERAEFARPPDRADLIGLIGIREPRAVWGAVLRSHPMITVPRGRSQLSIKAATGGRP